ncbi:MAG: class II aldolase/adducin family protein [Spirochaetales bacterium]|nr:class II aldolase/adducin family protein [Spirochaetales bacterium]
MNHKEAREALREAGLTLVREGLVARTWGNLSIKVDDGHFLITPSGRAYETVKPEEMSLVSIDDLSWEGVLKPSSEKELHARVYRCRPDVGAVVHTHQPAASSLAAARKDCVVQDAFQDVLGKTIPCAPYALPTTKPLAKAVEATVRKNDGVKAMLLANHGTACLGSGLDDAMKVASVLEDFSQQEVLNSYATMRGTSGSDLNALLGDYAQSCGKGGAS